MKKVPAFDKMVGGGLRAPAGGRPAPGRGGRKIPGEHPSADAIVEYAAGSLDGTSAEHLRVHLVDCDECYRTVVGLEGPDEEGEAGRTRSMVFTAPALPEWRDDRRQPWWNGPGRPIGDWRVAEQCRLGIDRVERDALVVCLQEERRPVPEALVVLEEAGGPAGPPLARGVTNDRGEARLRLRGDGWPSTGPFRIRILVEAED